jgi:hypothetical protein
MSAETNKRYTLIYPEDEHEKVQSVADQYGTSAAEVIRECIQLGVDVMKAEERGGALVERDTVTGKEREYVII